VGVPPPVRAPMAGLLPRGASLVLMALFADQKLEGLKRRHPGIPLKLISAAIGLISLLLGLALTVLFIWVIVIL
jgi:hypothetical protein